MEEMKSQHPGTSPVIVLSGGWGYGNMGDDALLMASVNLIRHRFPQSEIRIITYNTVEAAELLSDYESVSFHESIHRKLFPPRLFTVDTHLTFAYRLSHAIDSHKAEKKIYALLKAYAKSPKAFVARQNLSELEALMKGADYYIMGGGGYINDWPESLITKHIECNVAKAHGLKMLMIGQTIGPFNHKASLQLGQEICSLMDGMFFRDEASIRDCGQSDRVLKAMVPDLALFDEVEAKAKSPRIVFIPFKSDVLHHLDFLTDNFKAIQQSTDCTITVAITQQWQTSLALATACYLHLREQGVRTELVIPRNVLGLQELLASARLLISQNLHGLILGYRAGTDIISINSERKFQGFMSKVGLSQYILDLSQDEGRQLQNLATSIPKGGQPHNLSPLRREISEAFNSLIRLYEKPE